MSLTRVCPARTPLPPPVYVAGAVRDQTTAPHAPPAPLPRASPRTDVALLRQRQPAAAAAPPAAITTSRRCGHRAAPAAPPGLLPGLSRLPGHRPGLGEGGAAGRSSQHPPEGAGLCAAVSPRLCHSPRSLPLALALLPFCPDPLQPIRGQAPPCQERGTTAPSPPGRQRDPAKGGAASWPAAAPRTRRLLPPCPRPAAPGAGGGACPLPLPPDWRFLFPPKKSTHLLRPHREGRIWLPAAVQGTRPAAGERRAPTAPARQHGLGRRRLLPLPWAFSGLITQQRSQIFRPNAGFGASATSSTCTWLRAERDRACFSAAFGRPRPQSWAPPGQWRGSNLVLL